MANYVLLKQLKLRQSHWLATLRIGRKLVETQ